MPTSLSALEPGQGTLAGMPFGFTAFPDEAVEPFARLASRAFAAPMVALFLRQGDRMLLRCGNG